LDWICRADRDRSHGVATGITIAELARVNWRAIVIVILITLPSFAQRAWADRKDRRITMNRL